MSRKRHSFLPPSFLLFSFISSFSWSSFVRSFGVSPWPVQVSGDDSAKQDGEEEDEFSRSRRQRGVGKQGSGNGKKLVDLSTEEEERKEREKIKGCLLSIGKADSLY